MVAGRPATEGEFLNFKYILAILEINMFPLSSKCYTKPGEIFLPPFMRRHQKMIPAQRSSVQVRNREEVRQLEGERRKDSQTLKMLVLLFLQYLIFSCLTEQTSIEKGKIYQTGSSLTSPLQLSLGLATLCAWTRVCHDRQEGDAILQPECLDLLDFFHLFVLLRSQQQIQIALFCSSYACFCYFC